jgi:hypothetical protein
MVWPLQVTRLVLKGIPPFRAVFLTLGKIPEAIGVAGYWWERARGRPARLIEYK